MPTWKPGESGNPAAIFKPGHPRFGGRQRKRPITAAYEKALLKELPPEMLVNGNGEQIFPIGTTWLDLVSQAAVRQAASGDIRAARELRIAIEGREAIRIESFREFFEDEQQYDAVQQKVSELDVVDRHLIYAATHTNSTPSLQGFGLLGAYRAERTDGFGPEGFISL